MKILFRQSFIHTIAVLKGSEDYGTFSTAFAAKLMVSVQQLGFVVVSEKNYNIELIFSSDMKVCGVMLLRTTRTFMFICVSVHAHNAGP